MNKKFPIVAIVGQPNAGKSTLLNKIGGAQAAVTSDVPGTTRDRQYLNTSWNGMDFTLVDTAGLTLDPKDQLELSLNEQIDIALSQADAVLWVVDGKNIAGAVPQQVRQKFRKLKKPVILCVNKLDSPKTREPQTQAFKSLGIKKTFGVSALSGAGLGDMLDCLAETLAEIFPQQEDQEETSQATDKIAVAIVGKPNVGKSSIFNAILKEQRVVVSPVPGTTRASIDSDINIAGRDYLFIDTAGLKKKQHRQEQPDIFSGFQTFKSIRKSDVCLLVIDAAAEITKQDQRVAQEIFAMEKGCVLLANKSDLLVQKPRDQKNGPRRPADDKYQTLRDQISHHFPFLWMCPLFFVSAVSQEGLNETLSAIEPIFQARRKLVDNQTLSEFLNKIMKKNPPKLLRDQKKPKVFSLHQVGTNPPTFELKVNHPAAISQQFRKFLENSIIRELGFWGTPINLRLKGKDKT